ncbi:hypothetical protein SLA2020_080900 [Shorea laevis]
MGSLTATVPSPSRNSIRPAIESMPPFAPKKPMFLTSWSAMIPLKLMASREYVYIIGARLCDKERPMGVPRYEFACAICDNKIYVAGGKFDLASARGISSAEVCDPAVDTTPLPKMSTMRYKMPGKLSRTVSMVYIFDTTATDNASQNFEQVEEDGEKVLCSHCCVVKLS